MDGKTGIDRGASTPIPYLPALPVIGSAWDFRYRTLHLFRRTLHVCGDIGTIRIGTKRLTLLHSPAYVGAVLVDQANCTERVRFVTQVLEPLVGYGLIVSDQAFHRRQRKLVAPAFQHRRIVTYAECMTQYTEQIHHGWKDGSTVDIAAEMMRLTLRIVGKTLFDADLLHAASDIGDALTTVLHYVTAQATALVPLFNLKSILYKRQFDEAIRRLDQLVCGLIDERRRLAVDQGDFLSMLLSARDDDGQGMTDQQVRDEAMTLISAGHETTANALAWTWYLLTQHPMVYAHVREEVDQVLEGRTPTIDDLPKLPYTLQVFKESLRLYPPAYIIVRKVVEPVNLGSYTLTPGTNIGISPYTLHRNPAYFPDPERFNPDRWTPENEAKLPRYAYLPFGAGPHVCIGNHFAMMEAQLILATLTQRVTFELVPGQTIVPEPLITLRPKGGVRVVMRRR